MNIVELLLGNENKFETESNTSQINYNLKLSSKWQLWRLSRNPNDTHRSWRERIKQIGAEFDTLDSFWTIFNSSQIQRITEANECDFMLFRHDVPPMW